MNRLSLALAALVLSCSPASPPVAASPGAPPPPVPAIPLAASAPATPLRFTVTFPASLSSSPLDGRVLVVLAKDDHEPPRDQVSDRDSTAEVFGVDVDALRPGE